MVMGGMVLETNMNEIVTQIDAQNKLEKSEVKMKTIKANWCMIIQHAWLEIVIYLLILTCIQLLVLLQIDVDGVGI